MTAHEIKYLQPQRHLFPWGISIITGISFTIQWIIALRFIVPGPSLSVTNFNFTFHLKIFFSQDIPTHELLLLTDIPVLFLPFEWEWPCGFSICTVTDGLFSPAPLTIKASLSSIWCSASPPWEWPAPQNYSVRDHHLCLSYSIIFTPKLCKEKR